MQFLRCCCTDFFSGKHTKILTDKMIFCRLSHNKNRRGSNFIFNYFIRNIKKCSMDTFLIRHRSVGNHRNRCRCILSLFHQPVCNRTDICDTHQKYTRAILFRNMRKGLLCPLFCVTGKYMKTAAFLAVCQRNSGKFTHRHRTCHPRHQSKWDFLFLQC